MEETNEAPQEVKTAEENGTPLAQDYHETILIEDQVGIKVSVSSSIYSVFDLTDLALKIRTKLKEDGDPKGKPGYAG